MIVGNTSSQEGSSRHIAFLFLLFVQSCKKHPEDRK
jgi:hypothetical protein